MNNLNFITKVDFFTINPFICTINSIMKKYEKQSI